MNIVGRTSQNRIVTELSLECLFRFSLLKSNDRLLGRLQNHETASTIRHNLADARGCLFGPEVTLLAGAVRIAQEGH